MLSSQMLAFAQVFSVHVSIHLKNLIFLGADVQATFSAFIKLELEDKAGLRCWRSMGNMQNDLAWLLFIYFQVHG